MDSQNVILGMTSLVAIVAIVGMVMMFTNQQAPMPVAYGENAHDEASLENMARENVNAKAYGLSCTMLRDYARSSHSDAVKAWASSEWRSNCLN